MFAKSFSTTTAIATATHQQQPQQQHQETAANFIYHVPLRLQVCCLCCSARLVQLLSSFSAEQQIFFQRSNLVLANTQASFISQLTTRAHVLFFACLYAAIHIFFNEYYHKITYANTHILKSTHNTREYPWQLGKDLAICLCSLCV